jgi:hypothetical protein
MNDTFQTMQQGFQQQIDTSLNNFGHHVYNTMHDPMMQRLGDMQTDLQNDLNVLNDTFSQIPLQSSISSYMISRLSFRTMLML